jgi:hypothetical protein
VEVEVEVEVEVKVEVEVFFAKTRMGRKTIW